MRGKVFEQERIDRAEGITPAYAGKRISGLLDLLVKVDHPRICGEKSIRLHLQTASKGITPAYAGKR